MTEHRPPTPREVQLALGGVNLGERLVVIDKLEDEIHPNNLFLRHKVELGAYNLGVAAATYIGADRTTNADAYYTCQLRSSIPYVGRKSNGWFCDRWRR